MIQKVDTLKAIYKLSKLLTVNSETCAVAKPFALVFKLYALEEFPTKERYIGAIHSLLVLDLRLSQVPPSKPVSEIRNEIAIVLEMFDAYFLDFCVASDIEEFGERGEQEGP